MRKTEFGGARRWTPALMVVLGIASQASAQQARAGRVSVNGRPDTVVLDTTIRARRAPVVLELAQVDSLLRLQANLPIGSAEFVRVQLSLDSLIHTVMPGQVFLRATTVGDGSDNRIILVPRAANATQVRTGRGMGAVAGGFGGRALRTPDATYFAKLDNILPRGWIGMNANGFHNEWSDDTASYVRYFEYPIVVGVDASSPAARGGIRFGDSLIAYDGQDLRRTTINLNRLLEPGHSLAVKLRRDGELKELNLQVEKVPAAVDAERRAEYMRAMVMAPAIPAMAPMPEDVDRASTERAAAETRARGAVVRANAGGRGFGTAPVAIARTLLPTGIWGAQIIDMDQEGLRTLRNDKNANGVLVANVGTETPAYKLGLRSGDVISKVDDVKIESFWELQHELVLRRQNTTTKLTILRGKKTQTLVYEQPGH